MTSVSQSGLNEPVVAHVGLWAWGFGRPAEHGAQNIGPRFVFARAQAETGLFGHQILHRSETFGEFSQQRRAGGGDQFMRFIALRHTDAARAENRQRRRRGNRKSSMRTIHPPHPLDHRRCEHARFAKQFQCDAGAHDVHDRIHGADFVKMHAGRWPAVNFSLGFGNALEHRDGSFLHPI